jgi:hypothetical protein
MRTNISRTLQERFGDPIGSYAGEAPVGVRSVDEGDVCPECGMMSVGGACGCGETCGGCGLEAMGCTCGMGMSEAVGPCEHCGMLPVEGKCGCDHGEETCSGCGSSPEMCSCQVSVLGMYEGVEPCDECGMMPLEGQGCGCTHLDEYGMEEVAPPGKEKMVKALKKDPDIDNPWAVAWASHSKEKK